MGRETDVRELHRQLETLLRPPVKVVRDKRTAFREAACCRFRASVDASRRLGWSLRRLAEHAGCTVQHLSDCYDGKRHVPAWLFEALPRESRLEEARLLLAELKGVSGAEH